MKGHGRDIELANTSYPSTESADSLQSIYIHLIFLAGECNLHDTLIYQPRL